MHQSTQDHCYSLENGTHWRKHSQFTSRFGRSQLGGVGSALGPKAVTLADIGTYILGTNASQFMRKEFNPRWGPKEPNMWENGPLPPTNATFEGACAVAISDTEFILAGGKDGSGVYNYNATTSVFKHTGLREWIRLPDMLAPRYGHACALVKGQHQLLVVSGGANFIDGTLNTLKTTEIYNLTSGTWAKGEDMLGVDWTPMQFIF